MSSCMNVVRGCGRLLVLAVTWSDINVLQSVWEGVSWESKGGDGQIIPSAWWDWMLGLIDRLIIGGNGPENEWDSALGLLWNWVVGLEGMLAAERHGLNVHGTWFHLCLIYSYMILAKWSNKKRNRRNSEGDVNQALLLEYYFFISSEIDALRKEQVWKFFMISFELIELDR